MTPLLNVPLWYYIIRNLFRSLWDTWTVHVPISQRGPRDLLHTGQSVHPVRCLAACYPTYLKCRITLHCLATSCDASELRWLWCSSLERLCPDSKVIIHFWSHFSTYYITRLKRLPCPSLGPMHLDNYKSKPCISVMHWLEIKPSHHIMHPHNLVW